MLRAVDLSDHVLIGRARIVRPSENSVFQENHAVAFGIGAEGCITSLREKEARHHIGHDDRIREQFSDKVFAMRLVCQRDYRVGMGVVDMPEWQQGVQDGFDRRVRRVRIHQQPPLQHHHLIIAQLIETDHRFQRVQPHG